MSKKHFLEDTLSKFVESVNHPEKSWRLFFFHNYEWVHHKRSRCRFCGVFYEFEQESECLRHEGSNVFIEFVGHHSESYCRKWPCCGKWVYKLKKGRNQRRTNDDLVRDMKGFFVPTELGHCRVKKNSLLRSDFHEEWTYWRELEFDFPPPKDSESSNEVVFDMI